MKKIYEIRIKRLIGWGGSISDAVLKAGDDVKDHVLMRAEAAALRKIGCDFESRIKFITEGAVRVLIDTTTGDEIVRFSHLQCNPFDEIKKTNQVILTVQYATWDDQQ